MRIDDELLDGLQALKERDGVPVSEQVRRAIHAWLTAKGIRIAKAERKRAVTRRRP
jgi:hypothetical protein